jgi:hypothetical protein
MAHVGACIRPDRPAEGVDDGVCCSVHSGFKTSIPSLAHNRSDRNRVRYPQLRAHAGCVRNLKRVEACYESSFSAQSTECCMREMRLGVSLGMAGRCAIPTFTKRASVRFPQTPDLDRGVGAGRSSCRFSGLRHRANDCFTEWISVPSDLTPYPKFAINNHPLSTT